MTIALKPTMSLQVNRLPSRKIDLNSSILQWRLPMTFLSIPIGPHDVPFAAPLMAAAMLAFTLAFIILKLLDRVIDPEKHSSKPFQSDK
jgi:hypothetical protein